MSPPVNPAEVRKALPEEAACHALPFVKLLKTFGVSWDMSKVFIWKEVQVRKCQVKRF
jgi:hypothetical protein